MAWEIEGKHFETRSCDMVGPCTALLALGADYDRCRGTTERRGAVQRKDRRANAGARSARIREPWGRADADRGARGGPLPQCRGQGRVLLFTLRLGSVT